MSRLAPDAGIIAPLKRTFWKTAARAGVERSHVAAARMCCERHLLAAVAAQRERPVGRILCYHSIGQREWGVNDVSPQRFRRHIETALHAGYQFVPAEEIARTGGAPKDLAITFDDGLYSVLSNAAPILRDYGIPWTLFAVSEWCEQRHDWGDRFVLDWTDIEALVTQGAVLGSHSATHPDFGRIELAQIVDELGASRDVIKKRMGAAPTTFAIPLGQSANWTAACADAAREAGYEIVYAQAEETRPAHTVARTFVTRFDDQRIFRALLRGAYDEWEEWI